jgi:FtsP/CotA-like multicopper oxidase with cupredoxin domain
MMSLMKHGRESRRTGRRLEFLELEARWLLASVIQIPPAIESDGPLLQPPVIKSVNGVLQANVDMIRADVPGSPTSILYGGKPVWSNPRILQPPPTPGTPGFPPAPAFPEDFAAAYQYTTADGQVLPAQFPGPTLEIQPGDTVNLTIHNSLADTPSQIPPDDLITNIHFHGMDVNAQGNGDNVYREVLPGGTYQTQVQVPSTAPPGIDWYHPHHHMATSDQIYGGLAGAIQVGDPLDPWPQYLGQYNERLLVLSSGLIDPTDPSHPDERTMDDPLPAAPGKPPVPTTQGLPYDTYVTNPDGSTSLTWRKYVNGEFMPTLTLRPGQTEIWTFGGFDRVGSFNLGITDANGKNPWSGTILGYDGNETNVLPQPITLSLPKTPISTNPQGLPDPLRPDGPMTVDPGARLTLAVTAPLTPGTYYLVDNYTLSNLPYFANGGYQSFALATIQVQGAPVTTPAPVFNPTGSIPDLYTAIPDQQRTFSFESDTSGKIATMMINGSTFTDGPITPLQVGQVEQWTLINPSTVDHPFHIHQTDFAVISINGQSVSTQPVSTPNSALFPTYYHYTSLRDTVNVPAGGNVVVRFRVSPELGKYVFHCHILAHEDAGMMLAVLAVPNASQRRVALGAGAGQGGGVSVQDGSGNPIGRINPLPRGWKGGVATATGNLNGDMVQDIVAGPATRGTMGYVTVYDGTTLQPIRRFLPFPETPRSGVSLAIGDIDGSGKGDIIVARVGPGPSLVRIFRPDGTLWRTLSGVLPGRFPNGATVASADFNGDNYDDIAIGAGKGRDPQVVAIDGFSLGDPTGSKVMTLFSFRAPGARRAGVNLAAGYYDPQTRPSFLANLITTPQSGKGAGTVSVWAMDPTVDPSVGEMQSQGAMPMAMVASQGTMPSQAASPSSTAPQLMATLHPLGPRSNRPLRLAVSRLGKQGLDALAAWSSMQQPVYQSINEAGVVSTVRTPVS